VDSIVRAKGVRVDIWKARRENIAQISPSEGYSESSGPSALWIGGDNAERIPWRTLLPGYN
jgi:hypothetical protein